MYHFSAGYRSGKRFDKRIDDLLQQGESDERPNKVATSGISSAELDQRLNADEFTFAKNQKEA